jgi:hypothetical protein
VNIVIGYFVKGDIERHATAFQPSASGTAISLPAPGRARVDPDLSPRIFSIGRGRSSHSRSPDRS